MRAAIAILSAVCFCALAAAASAAEMEQVVVTGTRLKYETEPGTNPVTVIDHDAIAASGFRTMGEFLQSLPMMAGAPINSSVGMRDSGGGFSRGIETVELRGLGAERTLVLLNGRRFIAGGNGAGGVVDIGMIPIAMVERVEMLKAGASVEYGADAVAGVVNIITRQSGDGIDLNAVGSMTSRGDAGTVNLSAVYARPLDQGQLLVGLEVFDQEAVGKGDRDYSRQLLTVSGPGNEIVPDGSSAPPGGNFRTSQGRRTLIAGENGDSPSDFRPFTDADRFNFNPFEDLLQDSRRVSAFALARNAINENLNWFVESLFQQRDSSTGLAPLPFFTNRLDGVSVAADNAYNPFGEEISDARRRLIEGGPRGYTQKNDSWRIVLGLDGTLGDDWAWDANVNRARNEINQRQTGDLLRDRVALALGPSFFDNSGNAVCGTQGQPIADCVPLNLFGSVGSITQDMLDYAGIADLHDRLVNEQTVFNANFRGDLATLPAGPLAAAFGYEYRDESASDTPDPQTQAGNTTGSARELTRGSFDAHEFYAEFGAPLVHDRPGIVALDFETGVRFVNFSNFDSRTVYDVGLSYSPLQSLLLRAAYAQSFRAPTIGELFGGTVQSNPAVDDPCADFSQLTQIQIDRCVSQGVPSDGSFDQTGNETPQLGGGNPLLNPEDADSITLGMTWQPMAVEGLTIDLDYYDISIDDGIAALGANTVLGECLATGAASFCDRIERDTSGNILLVRSELQNIARETARGLDLETSYSHSAASGLMQHRLMLSYVIKRELRAFADAEPFVGEGGYDPDNFGAIPRWKGRYSVAWRNGKFGLSYGAQWIGGIDERGGELYPGTVNAVKSQLYHDISLRWQVAPNGELSLGVENLSDRDPPFLANGDLANTDVSTYRLLGRTFRLRFAYNL